MATRLIENYVNQLLYEMLHEDIDWAPGFGPGGLEPLPGDHRGSPGPSDYPVVDPDTGTPATRPTWPPKTFPKGWTPNGYPPNPNNTGENLGPGDLYPPWNPEDGPEPKGYPVGQPIPNLAPGGGGGIEPRTPGASENQGWHPKGWLPPPGGLFPGLAPGGIGKHYKRAIG